MRRLLLLLPFAAACHQPADINYICTDVAYPSLRVVPVDSASGDTIATGARLIMTDGIRADTSGSYRVFLVAAWERRGTFNLFVSAPGHKTWIKDGVVVSGDQCHVQTRDLVARLLAD